MLEPAVFISERASVDSEARAKLGRDCDSSRPSIGDACLSFSSMSVVSGVLWRHTIIIDAIGTQMDWQFQITFLKSKTISTAVNINTD